MDNALRDYVVTQLSQIFDLDPEDSLCTDLEKCIVRHSKNMIERGDGVAAWDNHKFTNIQTQIPFPEKCVYYQRRSKRWCEEEKSIRR